MFSVIPISHYTVSCVFVCVHLVALQKQFCTLITILMGFTVMGIDKGRETGYTAISLHTKECKTTWHKVMTVWSSSNQVVWVFESTLWVLLASPIIIITVTIWKVYLYCAYVVLVHVCEISWANLVNIMFHSF